MSLAAPSNKFKVVLSQAATLRTPIHPCHVRSALPFTKLTCLNTQPNHAGQLDGREQRGALNPGVAPVYWPLRKGRK